MFLLHGWFRIKFVFTYNISVVWWEINFRSSHCRCSAERGVLTNFSKSTGKHLFQSPFLNKIAGLRSAFLLKKRLWPRCFPVNFAKFLRTPFAQNTSGRLLLWTTSSETSNTKYLELIKRRSKVLEKKCHVKVLQILATEKHFSKIISQWEFDYGLFTNLPRIVKFTESIQTFLRVHSN